METAELQLVFGSLSRLDAAAAESGIEGVESGELLHEASEAVQQRFAPAPACMHQPHLSCTHARSVPEDVQATKMRCLCEQASLRRRKLCCGA